MSRAVALGIGLGVVAVGAAVFTFYGTKTTTLVVPFPPPTTIAAASRPATTLAASRPTSKPALKSFLDYARQTDERFKSADAAMDSKAALPMESSAAVVTAANAHLDRRGNLWLTHPDGPPIRETLKTAAKDQLIITRDQVEFVYWIRDSAGEWVAQPVTRATSPAGDTFIWHAPHADLTLARGDYDFQHLMLLRDDRMVVPTKTGVATLRAPALPPPEPEEGKRPVGYKPATVPTAVPETFVAIEGDTPVQVFAVMNTAIALRPWDNGFKGSAAGYIHRPGSTPTDPGEWRTMAGDETLPPQPMHLFALSDGSTLVLGAAADAGMEMTTVAPPVRPDEVRDKRIADLVEQLNASSADQRIKAANDIARFGPTAWPILERLRDAQTPEAQTTINKLLGLRAHPSLGVFTILPGPIRLIARGDDGTLALFAFGGVSYYEEGEDQVRSPALLIAPPDRGAYLAHPSLLKGRDGADLALDLKEGEIIARDPEKGALRLLGNHLAPMLKPEWKAFDRWVGTDRRDRWIFADDKAGKLLIIDRHLEDPTPRLPAWVMTNTGGESGWTADNQLVVVRGGRPWRLMESGWDALDAETFKFFSALGSPAHAPAPVAAPPAGPGGGGGGPPASYTGPFAISAAENSVTFTVASEGAEPTTLPAATPATQPSQTAATQPANPPPAGLLGGVDPLSLLLKPGVAPALKSPLSSNVAILKTPDNHTFYFDGTGHVLRLVSKNGQTVTDATFTENIPVENVRRIWLDPYNRICIVHGTGSATVLFPTGRIPPAIASLMAGGNAP